MTPAWYDYHLLNQLQCHAPPGSEDQSPSTFPLTFHTKLLHDVDNSSSPPDLPAAVVRTHVFSMLHFQLPLSMPSILSSNQYTSLASLPSPQTYAEYFKACQRQKDNSSWGSCGRTASGLESGAAPLVHGLRTPPRDMTAANFNPIFARGSQYNSVPPSMLSATSYSSTTGTFNSASTFTSGVHRSNGQLNLKPASRPQSPRAHRDNPTNQEQSSRRRSSSNGNAIVHYLQIPSTINDSKGSLAEFAAQVSWIYIRALQRGVSNS